jgi:hypothetical protein
MYKRISEEFGKSEITPIGRRDTSDAGSSSIT